jgi:hypothetical protein
VASPTTAPVVPTRTGGSRSSSTSSSASPTG